MNRNQKDVYCFIYDDNKHFYRATQSPNGSWAITHNAQMYPLKHSPKNLISTPVEMSTNKTYFSMARVINYPLEFDFDGAAILNSKYINGKGINENMYFAMIEFDPTDGTYKWSYNGRFDFQQKDRDEKTATFTCPVVDDSAWGILSQNDDVTFAFDCSASNPKAIKVLIDDVTLKNRYTFQTVQAPIQQVASNTTHAIPFILVNQDGDSSGIIAKSQVADFGGDFPTAFPANAYTLTSKNYFLSTFYQINGVNIKGSLQFTWGNVNPAIPSGGLIIYFKTSTGQNNIIFNQPFGGLTPGQTYNVDFNFNWNLAPGENAFLLANISDATLNHFQITPIVTSCFVSTNTTVEPAICYGLRPLDLLQLIVRKATLDRYSIGSLFFEENNKTVLISGESVRGIVDAKLYTSFKDFFESFSALFFMALRVVNGSLFMELADIVYQQGDTIIDLGEIIEMKTVPATDYYPNEMEVGSPNQDYRHPSGRLEFNSLEYFSFPFTNIKNKLSLTGKYRRDGYGLVFLLLDYRGGSTQDNSGDTDVWIVDITDEQGSAVEDIENFENITVNNAPLAPIIKYPLTGDIINFNKPLLKGIGIPGTNVNIYIADVLDGGTVVDGNGNWTYQIVTALPSYSPGVADGISVINATNTDMGGALNNIQLIIDTTIASSTGIIYPKFNDNLYNNLPLIKGVAPAGTNINIFLDGVLLAAVVADNSCKFEFKCVVPISNGPHALNIGGTDTTFQVNSFVDSPLITYCGSELDGFPIINNLPLIRGVAKPGTNVQVWLDYISYAPLGTVVANATGNWEIQVIPTTYPDPITLVPVVLAPIKNGANTISTDLLIKNVQINIAGFKLNRPAYDSITGVPDNTVINTRLSNKNAIYNHGSLLSAIMDKQRNDVITFQKHTKNSNLVTVLGNKVVDERKNITYPELAPPIAILEYANIKVISKKTFYKTLYDFSSGGTIKGNFKGKDIFFLPIGDMKMKSIMDDIQDWKLLLSPLNSYNTLLNLYKNGLSINLMENAIYHSDNNSLHFVEYNKALPDNYNFADIYDDWFTNRNGAYLENPQYIQKFQTDDPITDQVITNGIGAMTLRMYTCKDAKLVNTFNYDPVAAAPIPLPEIVLEAKINLGDYPPDQYFFVQMVGDFVVAISERIETRVKWKKTILIDSTHSVNIPGFFYSTGIRTLIRVEGLMKKVQPSIVTVIAKEESGDSKTVYSQVSKKRGARLGDAKGMPDYLSIKCATALVNDNCLIEGTAYSLDEDEKMQASEAVNGVPMFYYDINLIFQENPRGKAFIGQPGGRTGGVVLVVDASAVGLPTNVILDIQEQ